MPDLSKEYDSKWLKAGVHVKDGDVLEFLDVGKITPNKNDPERNDINFSVRVYRNGEILHDEKLFSLNASNFKAVAKVYGANSDNWVGKEVEIAIVNRQNPKGEIVKGIALFIPER